MQIDYNGRTYTVGRRYKIYVSPYRLKESHDDTTVRSGVVMGKLVFKRYSDGEGYHDYHHYGMVFEFKRVWRGIERVEDITMPDALDQS